MTHPELSSLTEQLVTPPPLTLWNSSLFSRIAWLPSIFCWLKQKGQHNKNIHMKNDKMIGSGLSDYSSLDCFCLYIYTTICIYFGRHYVWWPYDSNLGSSPFAYFFSFCAFLTWTDPNLSRESWIDSDSCTSPSNSLILTTFCPNLFSLYFINNFIPFFVR